MTANIHLAFALAAFWAGVGALVLLRPVVRGTTLLAAWWWSVASLASISGVEALAAVSDASAADWVTPARFAAAMTTFCPPMALLGAKRPQDRAWHFIVLSLWIVLSLPSFEWMLFGGIAEIHTARMVFLAILVALAALNGVVTRFWPSAVLACLGQIAVIAPYVALDGRVMVPGAGPLVGLALFSLGWLLMSLGVPSRCPKVDGIDRVWLDFRDLFGAVWGLRVMQRMNASAAMYDWPVELSWNGLVERARTGDREQGTAEAVEESLRTLLRRFVSAEWLDERTKTRWG